MSGRRHGCRAFPGKRRYRDGKEANRVKRHEQAVGAGTVGRVLPVRAYECDVCGGWHLTSRPLGGL